MKDFLQTQRKDLQIFFLYAVSDKKISHTNVEMHFTLKEIENFSGSSWKKSLGTILYKDLSFFFFFSFCFVFVFSTPDQKTQVEIHTCCFLNLYTRVTKQINLCLDVYFFNKREQLFFFPNLIWKVFWNWLPNILNPKGVKRTKSYLYNISRWFKFNEKCNANHFKHTYFGLSVGLCLVFE